MRAVRYGIICVAILVCGGFIGRDWLGITDIPVEELKSRYGQGARYVEVMGAQVRVKESGHGEPLLMLHGFASSADTWDGWRAQLDRQYRMIAIDVPPFAITGPLPGTIMNVDVLQSFMEELVGVLGLGRFYLAGNSLGGYIAWNYVRRHQEQVAKLVLVDSAGYPNAPPFAVTMLRAPVVRTVAHHLSPRPIVAASVRDVYGHPELVTEALIRRYQDMLRREGSRAAVIELMASLQFDPTWVPDVRVPTLILWGAKDRWIPPAHARLFQRDISGSQLVIYDELGHVPMEEDPERTASDVARFLQQ